MGKRDDLLHRFSVWSWYWVSSNIKSDWKTVIPDKRYFWHLWSKFKGKMIICGMWALCRMAQNIRWCLIRSLNAFIIVSLVLCVLWSIQFVFACKIICCDVFIFLQISSFNLGRSNLEYKVVASTQCWISGNLKLGCCKSIFT